MTAMNIKSDDVASSDYNTAPCIYLSDDQVEALGITTPPAPGTTYVLRVQATAVSVTAEVEEADEAKAEGSAPDVRMTLRLDDIEVVGASKDAASALYGAPNSM